MDTQKSRWAAARIFNVEEATFVKKSNMFKEEHFIRDSAFFSGNEVLAIHMSFKISTSKTF